MRSGQALPLAVALVALCAATDPAAGQDDGPARLGFSLGSPDASVIVVEYGDFACSACAQFAVSTWPTIRTRYVDSGQILWRMVPFELGFRNSEEGARAARCAAEQDAFWAMHDVLFARRDAWVGERSPEGALTALARSAGLDDARFEECYESDRMDDRMDAANRAAREKGVRGTPTFFIDGVAVQGALPVDAFVEILDRALASGGAGGP